MFVFSLSIKQDETENRNKGDSKLEAVKFTNVQVTNLHS